MSRENTRIESWYRATDQRGSEEGWMTYRFGVLFRKLTNELGVLDGEPEHKLGTSTRQSDQLYRLLLVVVEDYFAEKTAGCVIHVHNNVL